MKARKKDRRRQREERSSERGEWGGERERDIEREREREKEREREGIQLFSMLEQRTAGRWLLFIPSQASCHPKTENN